MPRIEDELLVKYGESDFAAVAVLFDPYVTDQIAELEAELSFPVLIDVDNEGQAVFGSPHPSYPRNVVIDREGRFVHWDLDGNLERVDAAIEALLSQERNGLPQGPR